MAEYYLGLPCRSWRQPKNSVFSAWLTLWGKANPFVNTKEGETKHSLAKIKGFVIPPYPFSMDRTGEIGMT
jgi:hypothetical protein